MLGGIGAQELILIFLVILLLFGARKIPEIAQGLGKGMKEFRKAMKETQDELTKPEISEKKTEDETQKSNTAENR
jgi:sec-independent protein translocase protein TatA